MADHELDIKDEEHRLPVVAISKDEVGDRLGYKLGEVGRNEVELSYNRQGFTSNCFNDEALQLPSLFLSVSTFPFPPIASIKVLSKPLS